MPRSAACKSILIEIKRLAPERQRPVLLTLDGGSGAGKSTLAAMLQREIDAAVIILDGAYSASPGIADLVDFSVLVDLPVSERHKRLAERENAQFLRRWHETWDEVEEYYFTIVRPKSSFDLIVSGSSILGGSTFEN